MSRVTYTVTIAHTGKSYTVPLTTKKVRELRLLGHTVEPVRRRDDATTWEGWPHGYTATTHGEDGTVVTRHYATAAPLTVDDLPH